MNIGVIGVGHIGGTLAEKFVKAGHQVSVANSRGKEAVPGKAPGVRDAINDHLMHLAKAPTHEEIIQVNRGAHYKE